MNDNVYDQEKKVLEAFKIMWNEYPEPAMLINRGKRVMAINWACRQVGPHVGAFCHEIGGCQDINNRCLINHCLESRKAVHIKVGNGQKQWSIHWVPIDGCPDYCVHFFAGSGQEHQNAPPVEKPIE